jgi:hypothetical protein
MPPMPQRVEGGRTIICPHCGSDISDRVLIIYPPHPGPYLADRRCGIA